MLLAILSEAPNVLIKPDGRACLTGFGLASVSSCVLTVPQAQDGPAGIFDEEGEFALNRVRWLAPELMENVDVTSNEDINVRDLSKASDVYSLGKHISFVSLPGSHQFVDPNHRRDHVR